jgi:hypothetical protein
MLTIRQETIDYVEESLPEVGPLGAFLMGVVCALAWADGKKPDSLLSQVSVCQSVQDAVEFYEMMKKQGLVESEPR